VRHVPRRRRQRRHDHRSEDRRRDFHSPALAKESDAEMFTLTREGKNKMPVYKGKLTDDQIKDLVKYIRSLK
jgi:mono/diheme cytochrome c family protein